MFYKSHQSKANFFELKCQTGVYKKQAKLHKIKNINYMLQFLLEANGLICDH